MKNRLICFIHIESCGGTSIHHLFHQNFSGWKVITRYSYWSKDYGASFYKWQLKWLLKVTPFTTGIGGHTTRLYLDYESVCGDDIFYMSFFREPLSRYMAQLNWQIFNMKIPWIIEDFVNEPHFNNYMVKRIAGSSDLEKAKDIIKQKLSFIGLQESFDESLLILKQKIEWINFCPYYERKNTAPESGKVYFFKNLDSKLKDKIIENNKLDIKFYKFIQELYLDQLSDYKGDIKKDLEDFKLKNQNYTYPKFRKIILKIYRAFFYYFIERILQLL